MNLDSWVTDRLDGPTIRTYMHEPSGLQDYQARAADYPHDTVLYVGTTRVSNEAAYRLINGVKELVEKLFGPAVSPDELFTVLALIRDTLDPKKDAVLTRIGTLVKAKRLVWVTFESMSLPDAFRGRVGDEQFLQTLAATALAAGFIVPAADGVAWVNSEAPYTFRDVIALQVK